MVQTDKGRYGERFKGYAHILSATNPDVPKLIEQQSQCALQSTFGQDNVNATLNVLARLRPGAISQGNQGGTGVSRLAKQWISRFPAPYNVVRPGQLDPSSSSGHLLGAAFGGLGGVGNITPMRTTVNANHNLLAETPLRAALRPLNRAGVAVCVSATLIYIPGQTPEPRIASWIFLLGIVAIVPGLPPIPYPMPPISNT